MMHEDQDRGAGPLRRDDLSQQPETPVTEDHLYQRLFERAPDAVIVVDSNGVIRKINEKTEELFGYRREELLGKPVELLIPDRYHQVHRHHRSGYFADPRTRQMGAGLELFGRNREGEEIPVDIMLSPIRTAEGVWALAVIRDVTPRKQDEAKIAALNAALNQQVEQLAAANRELEAFSYSVSHDLRAPLRHIAGFVELLNKRDKTGLDEKSLHYLQVIADAARRMGALIDDLLAFSRMGRVEMRKTRTNLSTLVQDVAGELMKDAEEREVDWQIRPLPVVLGDPAMLRLVLVNLLANALKFTRGRSAARIEVGAEEDAGETRVYVRDNGVGFNMNYVGKLFGLFQRLHTTEEFEGTGVGLANVQRIIHRHGGRVWAEGTVDGGATFWFSLPKAGEE